MTLPRRGNPLLQDVQPINALAQRIASSDAQFVVLLEHHRMTHSMDLLIDKEAAACLTQAGFLDFCAEHDPIAENTNRQIMERNGLKIDFSQYSPADILKRKVLLGSVKTGLKIHNVGDERVSVKETLEAAKKLNSGQELLVERLWVKPQKAKLGITVPGAAMSYFARIVAESMDDKPYFINRMLSNLSYINANPEKAANQFGGRENLARMLNDELDALHALAMEFRVYGQCDTNSARTILKDVSGRAILNFGWLHGVIAPNPASLSDQLISQSRAQGKEKTVEIIMMVDSQRAAECYNSMKGHLVDERLRTSVTAYDVDLKQEWSMLEWLERAPEIYKLLPKPPAGSAPFVG